MLPDIVCVYQSDKNAVLVEMPAARSLFYSRAFRTEFDIPCNSMPVEFAMKLDLRGFLFFGRGVTNRS